MYFHIHFHLNNLWNNISLLLTNPNAEGAGKTNINQWYPSSICFSQNCHIMNVKCVSNAISCLLKIRNICD